MTLLARFNSPLLLGFEQFAKAIDRISKTAEGYPPYNVEQRGEPRLRITLAVAGFTEADLSVPIEDLQLVLRGTQADDQNPVYMQHGIAARTFQRSFVLVEGLEFTRETTR